MLHYKFMWSYQITHHILQAGVQSGELASAFVGTINGTLHHALNCKP